MKITNEFKTGLVVVAAICVGMFFLMKTSNFSSKPYHLKTYFTFADGIKPDTIVKLSGIEVGRVEKIRFEYQPKTLVELTLALDRDAKVREDSIAFISTSGIVGDTYIGITPGAPGKTFIGEGATLASEDPFEMRKLMQKVDGIAENLDKTLAEARALAQNLNSVVKDNRPKIDNIVIKLEAAADNFNEFSDDIKRHPWKLLMKGPEKKGR